MRARREFPNCARASAAPRISEPRDSAQELQAFVERLEERLSEATQRAKFLEDSSLPCLVRSGILAWI